MHFRVGDQARRLIISGTAPQLPSESAAERLSGTAAERRSGKRPQGVKTSRDDEQREAGVCRLSSSKVRLSAHTYSLCDTGTDTSLLTPTLLSNLSRNGAVLFTDPTSSGSMGRI
jgi:hypothetical protein